MSSHISNDEVTDLPEPNQGRGVTKGSLLRDLVNRVPDPGNDGGTPEIRREAREVLGLSINDLAAVLGVPLETARSFESAGTTDPFYGTAYRKLLAVAAKK